MSKKIIISVVLAIVIVLGIIFFSSGFGNSFTEIFNPKAPVSQNTDSLLHISVMTGHISEIKSDTILVSGTVGSETKVIEFVITPKTTFTKDTIVISVDQAARGKSFVPQ